MKAMFFDTETTGTPKDYKAPIRQLDNWPRIIQLAWQVADVSTEKLLRSRKFLIKPDGWTIPQEKFWIDNGFFQGESESKGRLMGRVMDVFIHDLNLCDIIVAHNFNFDYPITAAEMIRYNKEPEKRPDRLKICTMENSVHLCKIPFPRGGRGYKWPKLEELYKYLFKDNMQGMHDAGHDVTACRLSFFELLRRNVIRFSNLDGKLTVLKP
jgi:DNA polymerase III subunit epsilon